MLKYVQKKFAGFVLEDIQHYGTIPTYLLKQLARISRKNEKESAHELEDILSDLRDRRGDFYLEKVKRRAEENAVIITIEKQ